MRRSLEVAMEHLLIEVPLTYLQFRDLVRLAAADPMVYAGLRPAFHLKKLRSDASSRRLAACGYDEIYGAIAATANPNARDERANTALHKAIAAFSTADVAKHLLEHGADPNVQNILGETPLHRAMWMTGSSARFERVKLLLDYGANPNLQSSRGNTMLHCASIHGAPDLIPMLVDAGGDGSIRDRFGDPPLIGAIFFNRPDAVNAFLAAGFDPNNKQDSTFESSCLHCAAMFTYVDNGIVETLLMYGADPNVLNSHGNTPMHIAARFGHVDKVQMLLAAGADPNAASNPERNTVLFYAIMNVVPNSEIVRMLLEAGARPDAVNVHNAIPADYATDHPEIVQMLESFM